MRLAAPFLLLAAAACAQTYEIRGVVIDAGTNHGVEGVEVTVFRKPPEAGNLPIRGCEVGKVQTDAQGAFVFRPDELREYPLTVEKPGFSPLAPGVPGAPANQLNVVLTKERPNREVRFLLGRPGEITGRVVDYDTGEPIPGFRLIVESLYFSQGMRLVLPIKRAVTDSEGRFRAEGFAPGQYVIEVGSEFLAPKDRFLAEFSDVDAALIDQDYEQGYFPAGPALNSALPMRLASGASLDAGTIRVAKIPRYRVPVTPSSASCVAGARVRLTVFIKNYFGSSHLMAEGETECGKPALFRGLSAGDYWLSARAVAEPKVQAEVRFSLTNANASVAITPAMGFNIAGRLVMAEGARPADFEKTRVSILPHASVVSGDEFTLPALDRDGRFHLENRLPGMKQISTFSLPAGTFVKQIRYRGTPLATNLFDFTGDGELEIEIDDQPAVVTGTVRTSGEPVERAHVAMIRWPMDPVAPFASVTRADADDDGKFQFAPLPGGEYRLLALTAENRGRLDEPGALQRLLPQAEKLTLSRGAAQTLTLAPLDPSR